ncbi:unnamed protein product [Owenia fusiformis]|uniref:TIR domain-containing protein n=1 Tax=Owenia fusiformis TaxID=6347 RepID=A0A8S4N0J2_OWEFU|nr:unnamed protein product [Owenia fusiformis]
MMGVSHIMFITALLTGVYSLDVNCKNKECIVRVGNNYPEFQRWLSLNMSATNLTVTCTETGEGDHNYLWLLLQHVSGLRVLRLMECLVPKLEGDEDVCEVKTLTDLNLSGNNVTAIEDSAFCGMKNIRSLDLSFNGLNTLTLSTLNGLRNHGYSRLQRLHLENNLIEEVTEDALAGLVLLKELYLSKNHIKVLPNHMFADLTNLRQLELNDNEIQTIGRYAFAGLHALVQLRLDGNRIMTFNREFLPLISLRFLSIDNNNITSLRPSSFMGLLHISKINLSWNKIKRLPPGLFHNMEHLRELDLSHNVIEALWPGAFSPDERGFLEELDISNNYVKFITEHAFQGLSRLRRLNLRSNELKSLSGADIKAVINSGGKTVTFTTKSAFEDLVSISYLDVSDNRITELMEWQLAELEALEIFNVSSNGIEIIDEHTFYDSRNLIGLYLQKNKLEEIHDETFSHTERLEQLFLSHNNLKEAGNWISKLQEAIIVDLSYNNIETVTISKLPKTIQHLHLQFNEITELPEFLISALETVKHINLTGNTFKCFCESFRIYKQVMTATDDLQTADISGLNMECSTPDTWRGKMEEIPKCIDRSCQALCTCLRHIKEDNIQGSVEMECYKSNLRTMPQHVLNNTITMRLLGNAIDAIDAYSMNRETLASLRELVIEQQHPVGLDTQFVSALTNIKVMDIRVSQLHITYNGSADIESVPNYDFIARALVGTKCLPIEGKDKITMVLNEEHATTSALFEHAECYIMDYCPTKCRCLQDTTDGLLFRRNVTVDCRNQGLTEFPVLPINTTFFDARHNNIKRLSVENIQNDNIISKLLLSDNQIENIELEKIVSVANTLNVLDLSNNKIALLNKSVVELDVSRFKMISLKGNQFLCPCSGGTWMKKWFLKNKRLFPSVSKISCSYRNKHFPIILAPFEKFACYKIVSHSTRGSKIGTVYTPATVQNAKDGLPSKATSEDVEDVNMLHNREIQTGIAMAVILMIGLVLVILCVKFRSDLEAVVFYNTGMRFRTDDPVSDRKFDGFVYYTAKDENWVINDVIPQLENPRPNTSERGIFKRNTEYSLAKKYKMCVHNRDVIVSDYNTDIKVRSLVEASQRTILVISNHFIKNEWCCEEFKEAFKNVLGDTSNSAILILRNDISMRNFDEDMKLLLKGNVVLREHSKWFWQKLLLAMPGPEKSVLKQVQERRSMRMQIRQSQRHMRRQQQQGEQHQLQQRPETPHSPRVEAASTKSPATSESTDTRKSARKFKKKDEETNC